MKNHKIMQSIFRDLIKLKKMETFILHYGMIDFVILMR